MAYRTAFLGSTPNNSFYVMWTGVCLGKDNHCWFLAGYGLGWQVAFFSTHKQTQPLSSLIPLKAWLFIYSFRLIRIDLSTNLFIKSENKEARREDWGFYIFPPSAGGAGCLANFPLLPQNTARDVRRIRWPREALCISLQKSPSQARPATSVLLSSKQRICTALRQALTLAE